MRKEDQIRDIARQLLEKSKADDVQWQRSGSDDADAKCAYTVQLAEGAIRVSLLENRHVSPSIRLSVSDADGEVLGELEYFEQEARDPDLRANWDLLADLYWEADRAFSNWDRSLQSISRALAEPGVVELNGVHDREELTST